MFYGEEYKPKFEFSIGVFHDTVTWFLRIFLTLSYG